MGNKPLDKTKPKIKHRKGLWSPDEDEKLRNHVNQHGHGCWSSVPINSGLERSGKSCRLRWINYLRPGLKIGTFNPQEEDIILTLHSAFGNKWSQIAQHLPGRTDNEIKNFWHSYLKKKVAKTQKLEPIPNTQVINSTFQTDIGSPVKSNTTTSSFDSIGKVEGSSMNVTQLASNSNNQSSLPKLFFAEWFNIDNSVNIGQSRLLRESLDVEKITSCNVNIDQNYSQDYHYLANNRKNNDFVIKNFVLEEGYSQGATYNEGTSSNDELCDSATQNVVFHSHFHNIEDETATFNHMFYENHENNYFMEGNV